MDLSPQVPQLESALPEEPGLEESDSEEPGLAGESDPE